MSLFDVIKYPISDPPTPEEINALPRDLSMKWLLSIGFTPINSGFVFSAKDLSNYFGSDEIEDLRKMVLDYEPV